MRLRKCAPRSEKEHEESEKRPERANHGLEGKAVCASSLPSDEFKLFGQRRKTKRLLKKDGA